MIEIKVGIYKIKNNNTGKLYIGSSTNIRERFSEHLRSLRQKQHSNNYLQNSWNKHGSANFTFEIVELCNEKLIVEREQYYINIMNSAINNNGYNIRKAGNNGKLHETTKEKLRLINTGKKHSEETKSKMSLSHKNFKPSEEFKNYLSKIRTGSGNPMFGKKLSEEHRKKISDKSKGKTNHEMTPEICSKISKSNKITWNTPEMKERCRQNMLGNVISSDTKRKISEALRGRKLSEEHRKKLSESAKNRVTDETKRRTGELNKGKKFSEETRLKMSISAKNRKSKKLS